MLSQHLPLLLPLLLPGPAAALTPGCIDVSRYGAVFWEETQQSCCLSKIVKPKCIVNKTQVCVDLEETFCDVEVSTECTMTPCSVEVTMPVQEEEDFTPNKCKLVNATRNQTETRYTAVNKIRQECDSIWRLDANGEDVWAGNENCVDVPYVDYEKETIQVLARVMESECMPQPPITFLTCRNMTVTQEQLCSSCQPRAVPKCQVRRRTECRTVESQECEPQVNTECNFRGYEPHQKFVHKERCLGGKGREEDDEEAEV
jgi:hypothetical protein